MARWQVNAPFPRPAHRTGRADFPHPALGEGITHLRVTPPATSELPTGGDRLVASRRVLRRFLRSPSTEAPSRSRAVTWAARSPPALPGFIGTTGLSAIPNGPDLSLAGFRLKATRLHRWDFPCCVVVLCKHAVAITPAGPSMSCRSTGFALRLRPPTMAAFPVLANGSAPALSVSRPARRSLLVTACLLAKSPCDPLHRRLRRLRCLRRRSDCYRLERPFAGRVSVPLKNDAFARRTQD